MSLHSTRTVSNVSASGSESRIVGEKLSQINGDISGISGDIVVINTDIGALESTVDLISNQGDEVNTTSASILIDLDALETTVVSYSNPIAQVNSATPSATNNTLAKRDGLGGVAFSTVTLSNAPTLAGHAATKGYVDTAVTSGNQNMSSATITTLTSTNIIGTGSLVLKTTAAATASTAQSSPQLSLTSAVYDSELGSRGQRWYMQSELQPFTNNTADPRSRMSFNLEYIAANGVPVAGSTVTMASLDSNGVFWPMTGIVLQDSGTPLKYYSEATHSSTYSGAWTTASLPFKLTRVGRLVTMTNDAVVINNSASSGNLLSATAISAMYRPPNGASGLLPILNNGTWGHGGLTIAANGGITINPVGGTYAGGQCGFAGFSMSWTI